MYSLPEFENLTNNYPAGEANDVKKLIGGRVNYDWIRNTCTIRISRAFNYAGHRIPKDFIENWAVSGDDGRWYAYRVRQFRQYLVANFGQPDFSIVSAEGDDTIPEELFGKKGVIIFHVQQWSDATGHLTLWGGGSVLRVTSQCADKCYFGPATKIELWQTP